MRFTPGILLLVLLVSSLSPVHGVLETFNTRLKCQCHRVTSEVIPIHTIERIQFFAAGNGCPKSELIVWRKNKVPVCLNPHVKWIKKLLKVLQK
ncbi:PREDICTED: C-X-C motif chemokine 13 [Condylura cristata]|uniref:C-X-C motif chemokine 13 n=1 Tax=Condylura cristata TaxID=143302 RepID=UPI0003343A5D|nr:PREDICTED: C-X-C motif chemokine 13 [Condylura cristata]